MSDATYRIDVTHDPHNQTWPWDVKITRLSDDRLVTTLWASTPEEAVTKSSEWIARARAAREGFAVFMDDEGEPVEGHSVRA